MELDADKLMDAPVYDHEGEPIGTVADVYVDDETGRAEWLLVTTGFLPRGSHVPARDVQPHEDGYRLPYAADLVKGAPEVDITTAELSEQDEAALYLYYGISVGETPSGGESAPEVDPRILQFVERLYRGRTDEWMDKHELADKAQAMGVPPSVLGHLDALPPGRLSKEQVARYVAEAGETPGGRDILDGLGEVA